MSPPDWFQNAVSAPRTSRSIIVDGATIHFDTWSHADNRPGLLFVHGNAAHSHWWDCIAPAFADAFNVAAIDLSGTGDSEHRTEYSAVQFAREIMAVGAELKSNGLYIVGHSFGGSMTRTAAFLYGDKLKGVVLVDSGISGNRGRREPPSEPTSGTRYYASLDEAKRRFRLRPPQPCENDYIIDYIAGHSLKQSESGYCFKLDQTMFSRMVTGSVDLPDAITMVKTIRCKVAFIYGEKSRFFPSEAVPMLESLIDPELLAHIDGAHHHVFLDQPLAFIETLGRQLSIMEARQGQDKAGAPTRSWRK